MSVSAIDPGPLSLIAAALQSRLQVAFPPEFFEFELLPARLNAAEWTRLVRRTPFIGLGWGGLTAAENGGALFKGNSVWTVFAVVSNQSGDKGRYLGDEQGVGLFQVIQAAVVVLNGLKIPGVGTCLVRAAENAYAEGWNKEHIAMAAIAVEVNLTLSVRANVSGAEATPNAMKSIASSWVFAPGTDIVISDTTPTEGSV